MSGGKKFGALGFFVCRLAAGRNRKVPGRVRSERNRVKNQGGERIVPRPDLSFFMFRLRLARGKRDRVQVLGVF